MIVETLPASRSDRTLVWRMMELYIYDFSEFEGADLNEHGVYGYPDLDRFWNEGEHYAFIVRADNRLAGFILVDDRALLPGSQRSIAEFFVLRKYRRRGVGKQAAVAVFERLPAVWEVREIANNLPAQQFWRKVISEYTQGAYTETLLDTQQWKGPAQVIDNRR